MTTHTPGPWQAEAPKYSAHVAAAIWRDGVRLAQVDRRPKANESEEMANARLIAAAPDLLAACQKLAEWDLSRGGAVGARLISEACSWARAALAKAQP